MKDAIKVYNLQMFATAKGRLANKEVAVFARPTSHRLQFSWEFTKENEGKNCLQFAENTLTGEKYLILSRTNGLQLKRRPESRQGYQLNNKKFICFLRDKLGMGQAEHFHLHLSANVSQTEENATFKIEKKVLK